MRNRISLSTLVCCVLGLALPCTARANPTGKAPNKALAAHGTIPEAKALTESLYKIYEEEEKFVIDHFSKKENPVRFSDKQISKAAGKIWKARRDANHLKLMGEPAAEDLSKKLFALAVEIDKLGILYRGTPKGSQLVQRYQQQLNREKPRFMKFLDQAEGAIKRGQYELVEQQLEQKGVQLYEKLVYFSPTARKPYNGRFNTVIGNNQTQLDKKRGDEYKEKAREAMVKHATPATEFPAEADRIVREIASSGTAKLAGDKTGGPAEALAHVASLWGHASAGLARAAAVQWAFTNRARVQVQPSPDQLKAAGLKALSSVVEAAAVSTPSENAGAVYADLLKQISAVDRRISPYSKDVATACEPALAKLAAKNTSLKTQIANYQRATSEPLRWRKLYAGQQAKNLAKQFPLATRAMSAKSQITEGIRPNFVRQINREVVTAPPTFAEQASWMVQEASAKLVGKPISEERMIRLTPTSRTAVVPHDGRHYGNVPVPMPSDKEVADLKQAIVVDDTHGPLSIDAAHAVSAGELHDYVTVSGVVQAVTLEPLVSRFIGLSDVAYTLAPLGKLPPIDESMSPLSLTCWRLDTRPMWAHHPYFTVRVTKSSK